MRGVKPRTKMYGSMPQRKQFIADRKGKAYKEGAYIFSKENVRFPSTWLRNAYSVCVARRLYHFSIKMSNFLL